jgi:hypothetical protein
VERTTDFLGGILAIPPPSRRLAVLGLAAMLAGCASLAPGPSWPRTGDPLVDGRTAIAQGPARDRVLWQYRTAAAAMRRGQWAEAKSLLDDALLTVGGISAKDREAAKARSLFHAEARKAFKGEPYERVMGLFYRGILYWMDGERDNARACFRGGEIEDGDTQNKEYAADYVLLDYLDGFATVKLGGDGAAALKRAQAEAKLARPLGFDAAANVLVFAEFGNGPRKYGTGEYGEQLRFRPGAPGPSAARFRVQGQQVRLDPWDDLYYQATTRGGRVMDHILGNKAVFKSATDTVGDAALIGGAILGSQRRTREAGLGLAAAGLVSKIVSAATTPAADVRCWDNLPQYLSFGVMRLPPGQYTATVEFLPTGGSLNPSLTRTVSFQVTDTARDTVVFVSDKNQ